LRREGKVRLRGIGSVAFAAAFPFICAHAVAGSYEQPPSFSAAQVLPPNLLSSPNYTVANQVGLDNFQYVFNLDTRWGPFTVKGLDLMRVRAREMAATAALAQIDSAGTMVNAAGRTALKPLATAKDLVTAPGRTIGDTITGVGNFFGSVDASVAATDPHKERLIASVTAGAAIGETGTDGVLAFVTGGAGIAISVGGTSRTLRLALLNKTAAQLEKDGRIALAAMGIPGATVDAFYANPHLSPTDKAVIVAELGKLRAASGREIFIASAAGTQSIEMGFFYRRQAELIADYDERIAPVTAFVRLGDAPMLQTAKGTVSILPVDYLYWSPPLEALAGAGGGGQMWVTGRASAKATAQLAARGWTLVPKAGHKLGE
jgi:hypothetical protein